MGAFIDLTGNKYGRLTVVRRAGRDKNNLVLWECLCSCGKAITTRGQDLRRGASCSCGCLKIEQLNTRSRKHGACGTRPYRIWKNMKTRCYNPKTRSYQDYGARGISICKQWRDSFDSFWADMKEGYADTLEIDRIDHDGNYSPENCRWATKTEQNRNTRTNHFVTTSYGTMSIAELAEKTDISYDLIKRRAHKGILGDLLLLPVTKQGGSVRAKR